MERTAELEIIKRVLRSLENIVQELSNLATHLKDSKDEETDAYRVSISRKSVKP